MNVSNERKQALVERAVKEYKRMLAENEDCSPIDGVIFALEEYDLDGLLDDDVIDELDFLTDQSYRREIRDSGDAGAAMYPYEKLSEDVLNEAHQNYAECEEHWMPIQEDVVKTCLKVAREVLALQGDNPDIMAEAPCMELLEAGRVVHVPFGYIRKYTTMDKCPRCGASIPDGMAALSRYDNKTYICDQCGTAEAMEDYFGYVAD